jgi:type II secretory pathway pseudopilin PulG
MGPYEGSRSLVRLCIRVRSDERGFSLIETVIAIGLIFVALVTLAYAATSGFGYQALARERQAANGLADKMMEEVRGLAYESIRKGLAAGDLSTDTQLVSGCTSDPTPPPITYRYPDCAGEKLVYTSDPSYEPPEPLNEHVHTIAESDGSGYPTDYVYRIYITNNCPTGTETGCTAATPYRVTVIVSWAGGRIQGVAKSVTTQSLFYSPSGCVSNQTHPYAAPCQPFFYGQAQVPRGSVAISGSILGLPFAAGGLFTSGVESDAQHEQFSAAQGAYMQSAALLLDTSGTEEMAGGMAQTIAASEDPTAGAAYASTPDDAPPPGAGGNEGMAYGQTEFWVVAPDGETAELNAATAASATDTCPPWGTTEGDEVVCSGSKIQQGGLLTAWVRLGNIFENVDLGTVTFATIGAASLSPNRALVDRDLVSGEDGTLESKVERHFGTVQLVGLPSAVPSEDITAQLPGWGSYLVTMSGYSDAATTTVGTGAPDPDGGPTSGTILYWNGAGYSTAAPEETFTPAPVTLFSDINGHAVEIDITSSSLTGATFSPTHTDLSGSPAAIGEAKAEMSAPLEGTIHYVVTIDPGTSGEATVVDVTVQVALGTMIAKGVFERAPIEG